MTTKVQQPEFATVSAVPRFEIVDPAEDSRWDEQVAAHPDGTAFHTSGWARVLARTYGHRPLYLRCSVGDDVAGLLPMMEIASRVSGKRGVALPFTDRCAPLLFQGTDSVDWLSEIHRLATVRGWKRFELRGGPAPEANATPSQHFHIHLLDLKRTAEELFASFEGSVRGAIRKAQRNGVEVAILRSVEGVAEYYRLHTATRRHHGLPPQPWAFFRNIFEEMVAKGCGFVALARRGSRAIAGALFLEDSRHAIYKFAASDFAERQHRPNNLVLWESIQALAAAGCRILDFGRTALHQEDLRRFKLVWGVDERAMEYYRWDRAESAWTVTPDKTTGFHTRVFSHLPLALNKVLGGLLYPHLD
jgi:hypothetical protein